MSEDDDTLVIPTPKFCPMCGSQNLCEKFDGWEEHARKTGSAFGECNEPDCNAHFGVSTYHRFVISDDDCTCDADCDVIDCSECDCDCNAR